MKTNNISTNIIRDSNKKLEYIVTPNSKEIFDRIFSYKGSSVKSFNLIGNYGTGKSTFLWALERNLNKKELFFSQIETIRGVESFEFIKIIGDNNAFSTSLTRELSISENSTNEEILTSLEKHRIKAEKKKSGLVLLVDEFGKFLEYAAKNNKLDELFLLQKIAEWVNNDETNVYFILTLHQNFTSYGKGLNEQDKLEWEKIKGRFTDLLFNEPVEQLLFFASNKLQEFKIEASSKLNYQQLLDLIKGSNLISYNSLITDQLSESLYPLDWISATVLVNSLQRYGQNERSLFSFLNDNSEVSIRKRKNSFFTVANVFDYLVYTLPSEITGMDNPHKPQWNSTFKALERAELIFEEDYTIATEVIKTIGLSNIFTKAGGLFDQDFIRQYFQYTRDFDINNILLKLEKAGIIRFYKHSNKVNFLEGTDLDLEQELILVSKEINSNFSITNEIINLIDFPIILAKKYSAEKGTSRFFEFRVCDDIEIIDDATGVIDGYINLIFDDINLDQLKEKSKNIKSNIFVLYKNTHEIKKTVFTILKLEKIRKKHADDTNAIKLLNDEKEFHYNILKELINSGLYSNFNNIWIHNGDKIIINNRANLNEFITKVCNDIYYKTPTFFNELINKEHLSTPINSARKSLLRRIIDNENIENLGFENEKFPPEKAIYLSLLKRSNIHRKANNSDNYEITQPYESSGNQFENSLFPIWKECDIFLDSCNLKSKSIDELYSILTKAPYKLKKGFLDFWIPIYLLANRENFALFHRSGGFTPYLSDETLDLIHKKPSDFFIKSYDVSGIKINILEGYKAITQINSNNGLQTTFLSIFGNFLRFHRSLTPYALRTSNLTNQAVNLRDSIKLAKDPEDALFDKFPAALGYHNINSETEINKLTSYVDQLQKSIKEIREVYNELLENIEKKISSSFGCSNSSFPEYKLEIIEKLDGIDLNKLNKTQRIFFERLTSPLDDRISYIKSLADVALNKRVEDIFDEEIPLLYSNIEEYSNGLINTIEIHKFNSKSNNSKMISFSLTDEKGNLINSKVIISDEIKRSLATQKTTIQDSLKTLTPETQKGLLIELLNDILLETKS
jgi:flagellar biosynthesis chaperone FliJ